MAMLNILLTDQIEQQLAKEAQRENKTRSEIAHDALLGISQRSRKNVS